MKGVSYIREDVTEWGDYSIESAYATSGTAPRKLQRNTPKRRRILKKQTFQLLVKAKGEEKQAQKEKSEQEALNKKNAEDDAAKAIDEAQQKGEALKDDGGSRKEMAEMNAIKEKLAKKDASQNANASVSSQTNNPNAAVSSTLSRKPRRQKKKEKAAAAAAAAEGLNLTKPWQDVCNWKSSAIR